tara:strand:+ start:225 stop:2693 length:2469 start_codon:yes stop_codon:yes gene_type:complete
MKNRKLAAIMFTDIADYTSLSAKNETRALDLLDTQREIISPILLKYNGILHKEIGDGLLFTFKTVTEALKCALEIQNRTKKIKDLNLRIGVHEGEVTFKDGDVLGDDVNIASRIEPYSAIGGIAISGKVQQDISSIPEYETKFIAKPNLKGVIQEVKIYCISSHGLPLPKMRTINAKLDRSKNKNSQLKFIIGVCLLSVVSLVGYLVLSKEDKVPSIAIIPIENKGNKEDDFYSYGISSDLISDVAGSGEIRVASLKDIEKIDYLNLSNKEISDELFVRYISQGSLWKNDSLFQLSIELYDTEDEKILWSERWINNWNELPQIKNNLQTGILKQFSLSNENLNKSVASPEAYEYYLKAQQQYDKFLGVYEELEIAKQLILKSISLDSNFIESQILHGKILWNMNYNKFAGYKRTTVILTNEEINLINEIRNIFQSAYDLSEKFNNKRLMSISKRWLGNTYSPFDNEKTMIFWQEALNLALEADDLQAQIHVLGNMSNKIEEEEKFNEVKIILDKKLNISKKINDLQALTRTYLNFGDLHYKIAKNIKYTTKYKDLNKNIAADWIENLNTSIEYSLRALNLAEERNYISDQFYAIRNLINVYMEKSDYEKATKLMNSKGSQLYMKNKKYFSASRYLSDQALLSSSKGDFKSAFEYENKLYDFYKNSKDKQSQIFTLLRLAVTSTHLNKLKNAKQYIKEVQLRASERGLQNEWLYYRIKMLNYKIAKIEGKTINKADVIKEVDTYLAYLKTQSKLYTDYTSLGHLAIYDIYTLTEDPELIKQGYNSIKKYEKLASLADIKEDFVNNKDYYRNLIIEEYNKLFKK